VTRDSAGTNTTVRGTSGSTIGRALASGFVRAGIQLPVSLVLLPVVLGRVAAAQYGVWATLSTVVALGGLADAGVRTELVRRVADGYGRGDLDQVQADVSRALTVVSVLSAGVALVLSVAARAIVPVLLPGDHGGLSTASLTWLFCALVWLTAVLVVVHVCGALLLGVQRADLENLAWLLGLLAYVVTTVIGLRAGLGLGALVLGTVASTLVGLAAILWSVTRSLPEVRLRWGPVGRAEASSLLALSTFAMLSQVSDVVDTQVDKLILARLVSSSAAGWYDIGATVVSGLRVLALLPLAVLLAGLAELLVARRPEAVALHLSVARVTLSACVVVLGGAVVLGPAFAAVWLGPGYEPVGRAIRLLSVAMLVNALAAPGAALALATRQHVRAALASGVNIVVNLALSVVLAAEIGFAGPLLGSIAGNVVATIVFLALLRRVQPELWRAGLVRPSAVGAVLVLLGCWLVPACAGRGAAQLLLAGGVWIVVSATSLVLTSAVGKGDLVGLRVASAPA
jgi:O-antigen/teichoic acid export membrane protein